jgi:phage-related tail fiber protein
MSFGGIYFTNKGRALQAKAQIGTQLNFTRLAVGDGSLSGQSVTDMTAFIHEVLSIPITKAKTLTGGVALIGGILSNQGLSSGFYWREFGLFAQDPDEGEILYCYGNAGALAEYIPAGGGADILEKQIAIEPIIGSATNVTASINQSLVYATQDDLNAKVDKVSGKQLSTNDYTTAEKDKLTGIANNANNYSHPSTHASTMIVMGDGTTLEAYKADITQKINNQEILYWMGGM